MAISPLKCLYFSCNLFSWMILNLWRSHLKIFIFLLLFSSWIFVVFRCPHIEPFIFLAISTLESIHFSSDSLYAFGLSSPASICHLVRSSPFQTSPPIEMEVVAGWAGGGSVQSRQSMTCRCNSTRTLPLLLPLLRWPLFRSRCCPCRLHAPSSAYNSFWSTFWRWLKNNLRELPSRMSSSVQLKTHSVSKEVKQKIMANVRLYYV